MANEVTPSFARFDSISGGLAVPSLSLAQFLDELRKVRKELQWNLDSIAVIEAVGVANGVLRVFNPVTALAYVKTGEFYPGEFTREAGRRIGLSFIDTTELATSCQYSWHPQTKPGALRNKILGILAERENRMMPPTSPMN